MPCRDYESDWFSPAVVRNNPTAGVALKDQADKLARYACQALAELEKFDPELKSIKDRGLKSWYKNHKKADEARIAKELKEKENNISKIMQLSSYLNDKYENKINWKYLSTNININIQ